MEKNKPFLYSIFSNVKYLFFLLLIILSLFSNFIKKKPKISVFIPIYNSEKHIKQSIQSIQNQTLKNIEIIAVNDGSKDNTINILTDLAKNDHRIKIVNNDKNHGLLYSRAMGILNTSGEYIMNLDSDDEISDNECLEYVYNQTHIFKADILAFNVFFKINNAIINLYINIIIVLFI